MKQISRSSYVLICLSVVGLHPSFSAPHAPAQLVARPPAIIVSPAKGPAPADELGDPNQQPTENQSRQQAFEAENAVLRRRNDLSKQTIHSLTESLAVANAEGEVFKRQYSELKLRMEALGMAAVGDNKEALEQRLLESVNDLRLLQIAKDKISERMVALSETTLLYIKTSTGGDPQTRMQVEAQLRAASKATNEAGTSDEAAGSNGQADLSNGRIISVNEQISLVVVNLGAQHGVKVGMPFQIVRANRQVGHVRVVDVRERISGAIIEDYGSNTEKVKVGDAMRVDVQS